MIFISFEFIVFSQIIIYRNIYDLLEIYIHIQLEIK